MAISYHFRLYSWNSGYNDNFNVYNSFLNVFNSVSNAASKDRYILIVYYNWIMLILRVTSI